MNIVYVYGRKWPSKKAGISFSTYTGYGIAENDSNNNIDLIFAKNTDEKIRTVLKGHFSIDPLSNFKIHLMDNSGFSETTKFYFQAFNKIRKLNQEKNVDVVITRTVKFLPFLYLLKKIYNITVIYEAHSFYLDPKLKKEYDRKKEYLYQRYTLGKIDGIICHQNILKNLYKKYFPEQNYCVARTGINDIYINNNLWDNEYVGYVGSLYESKGVKDLFYAFRDIEDPELKLLIVGGRPKRIEKYYKLAEELGIRQKVEITGWVNKEKMNNYIKKMKFALVPIQDTFHNRYLTSPMKIFDYFSHGLPIISSDLPPAREIITENGGLFYETENIAALTDAIDKLNSSKDLHEKYSTYIRKRAKSLSWRNRGKLILDFINEINNEG